LASDYNGNDEQLTLRILAGFINVAEEFLYVSSSPSVVQWFNDPTEWPWRRWGSLITSASPTSAPGCPASVRLSRAVPLALQRHKRLMPGCRSAVPAGRSLLPSRRFIVATCRSMTASRRLTVATCPAIAASRRSTAATCRSLVASCRSTVATCCSTVPSCRSTIPTCHSPIPYYIQRRRSYKCTILRQAQGKTLATPLPSPRPVPMGAGDRPADHN